MDAQNKKPIAEDALPASPVVREVELVSFSEITRKALEIEGPGPLPSHLE